MAPSSKAKATAESTDADLVTVGTEPAADTSGGKSVEQLVNEVLGGRYGDHDAARTRLNEEGYDAAAVLSGVNARLASGAPHAYAPTGVNLVQQVQNGEWGESKGLAQRLRGAGFSQPAINEVLTHLDKE